MRVVLGVESYLELAEDLKRALERLGVVPAEHTADSRWTVFRNL